MAVRAEPIDRLRDDVRLLGELVGDGLREQGGRELFEDVEHIRQAAVALRGPDGTSQPWGDQQTALLAWAEQRSTQRLLQLVRAFSVYFHLINLAEQHHRPGHAFAPLPCRLRGGAAAAGDGCDSSQHQWHRRGVADDGLS